MELFHRKKKSFLQACRSAHLCFVPHEHNDFIPKAAQHKMLFGYSFVLLAVKMVSILLLIFLPASSLYSSAITRSNIIDLTNAARANAGLPALQANVQLSQAAQAKAQDMAANQYFAHTSPSGVTPWSWIKSAGYSYKLAGENLAVHYSQSEDVQSAWMASASHRSNILSERFREIGVGIVSGTYEGFDTIFVVQMFGEPKTVAVDTPVETTPEVAPPAVVVQEPEPELPPSSVAGETTTDLVTNNAVTAVSIVPQQETGSYKVELTAPSAASVNLIHNGQAVALTPLQEKGEFKGEITSSMPVAGGDDTVVASVLTDDGSYITEPVAVFSNNADASSFYVFTPPPNVKLFGVVELKVVQNGIAMMYAIAAIFLCGLLLSTVLIRFEHQRHSVTAHLLVVLILTSVLLMM